MCGIAGILGRSDEAIDRGALRRMVVSLAHRGPDGSGVHVAPGIGLAHTRLSIIDPSDNGAQPWVEADRALVYNGEIYNHRELRAELEAKGYGFKGSSDSEVLFHALAAFGVRGTLDRVRGMFAFAYADSVSGEAYLCRDRLGIKPLVYGCENQRVVFASEVKALQAVMAVDVEVVTTLFSVAGTGDHSGRYTPFHNVRQVPPGHFVRVHDGEPDEPSCYYRVEDDVDERLYRELEAAPDAELDARLAELLRSSVDAMLMSDVPIGAFVSGGVDSSLIASLANTATASPLALFTSDVVGRHSELADARLLATSLNRPLHVSRFSPEDFIQHWARCTYHYEAPIVTHSNSVPFSLVAQLAHADGVKPVLTGEGADELFLGYPTLLAERFRPALTTPIRAVEWPYKQYPPLAGFLLRSGNADTKDFLHDLAWRFEKQQRDAEWASVFEFVPESQRTLQLATLDMLVEHLPSLLHRNDRMGMLAGVESRFPFLDEDLVRFGINLPAKRKAGRTWRPHNRKHLFVLDKAPLRRVANTVVKPKLSRKVKSGFPMYGLRDVRARPGAFRDGYLASTIGLDRRTQDTMLETQAPYQVAKLVSVEMFGRLFAQGQSVDTVTGWAVEATNMSGIAPGDR